MDRRSFTGGLLILFVSTSVLTIRAASPPADDFYLKVTIVTGEHSRDSNSIARTLTAANGELLYEETYEGARSNLHPPLKRKFKLTTQDQAVLIGLLRSKNLLVTKTIEKPPTQKGFSRYFELAIISALQGQENTVAIEASPYATELKTEPLFQGSVELIKQLYQIIHRTDRDLNMPALLNED